MAVVAPGPTLVHGSAPGPSRPITAHRYVSSDWLAEESEHLWPTQWLAAGLTRDVDAPGKYVVFSIGRESIVIAGTSDGGVAASYNVCRHRGARVVPGDRGCADKFTCPYHGWSYRPDGRLVVVPDNDRFPGGRVDRADRSLKPVRVETWLGLVWVCMSPHTAPLRAWLGPVAERLDPYDLDDHALVSDQSVELGCNWKAVFDNFGELYHVEHIHPQHQEMFDCPTATVDLFANGHTSVTIDGHTVNSRLPIPATPPRFLARQLRMFGADPADYHDRVLDIRNDIQKLRRRMGPARGWDYDAFTDRRLSDIEQYNIFPNTMITVQPDDAIVARARPHATDPNLCLWDMFTFHRHPSAAVAEAAGVAFEPFDPGDVAAPNRPEHDGFTEADVLAGAKSMTSTIDQDIRYISDVQAGMHSRGFDEQLLNNDEVRIQHYHDWLNHVLGDGSDGDGRVGEDSRVGGDPGVQS